MACCAVSLNLYGSCGCSGGSGGSTWGLGPRTPRSPHPRRPSTLGQPVLGSLAQKVAFPRAWPPLPPPPYQAVQAIVVPHEGVEGPQLGPAHTQLLRSVAQEATDVGPHQGHPQQIEEQDFWRAESDGPPAATAGAV